MSSRIPDTHAEAWALLPWLANGRIQASDREWVEAHLAQCAECRGELVAQRKVASEMNGQMYRENYRGISPEAAATAEHDSFNKLWARIEASESAALPDSSIQGTGAPVSRASSS